MSRGYDNWDITEPSPKKVLKIKELVDQLTELQQKVITADVSFNDIVIAQETQQIKYFDEEKKVFLVSSQYINGIINSLNKTKNQNKELAEKSKQLLTQSERLKRQNSHLITRIQKLESDLKNIVTINHQLQASMKSANRQMIEQSNRLLQFFKKDRVVRINHTAVDAPQRPKFSTQSQTDYWKPHYDLVMKIENVVQQRKADPESQMQQQMRKLHAQYEQRLNYISNMARERLREVESDHQQMKQLVEKNKNLTEDNERIKWEMSQIQIEREKAQEWKRQVREKVIQFEQNAMAPLPNPVIKPLDISLPFSSDNVAQQVQLEHLRRELSEVRGELMQKRLEVSELKDKIFSKNQQKEVLLFGDSITDDNTIGKIMTMSQKIKEVTEFLINGV